MERILPVPTLTQSMELLQHYKAMHVQYKQPERGQPYIMAPMSEIIDNSVTALLDSTSGNPPLNRWTCEDPRE